MDNIIIIYTNPLGCLKLYRYFETFNTIIVMMREKISYIFYIIFFGLSIHLIQSVK